MGKLNAIRAQLEAAAGRGSAPVEQEATSSAPRSAAAVKSREGRVHVGAWLPKAYASNILLVRAKTGLPVKTIFAIALNDVFRANNVPVIDED
jgi:hypothetical protein